LRFALLAAAVSRGRDARPLAERVETMADCKILGGDSRKVPSIFYRLRLRQIGIGRLNVGVTPTRSAIAALQCASSSSVTFIMAEQKSKIQVHVTSHILNLRRIHCHF
jgi:hypothetical protein